MGQYPHIFASGQIGGLTIKNRVKYAATETNFNTADGYVTDREVAYMEAQARGGAGIVTTQGAYPDPKGEGKGFRGMMAIYDDKFIPGLARIADVIRKNGALSCIQILHCGREGGVELDYSLMPSVVPQKLSYFKPPREITTGEIKKSIKDHADAARRAVAAGFDMVELSGIVGYLLSTFISSYTNKRTDEYGGDINARCRLMVETIQAVKAETGNAIPIGIRLCGHELLDDRGGNTMEESIKSFKIAEEAGADFLSVTIGWHESSQSVITRDVPMGHWLWIAGEVKKHVAVPVMMAFRQFLPSIPEKAIADGMIDFWEACRPMIADPELPKKALEGREEEIVPCIACNLCFSRLYYHQPIMCSIRPTVGYEGDERWGYYGFSKTAEKKNIAVIGAGPAGLQYASVASQKGHRVTIYEKAAKPGGSVLMAAMVDEGAIELMRPINQLAHECHRNGVVFQYETAFSPDTVSRESADIVVIAAGAKMKPVPFPVDIPVLLPEDIFLKGKKPSKHVVILGGSGTGLGVAVYLLRNSDYTMTIIEDSTKLGRDVNPFYLWQYIQLMKKQKVTILTGARVENANQGIFIIHTPKGDRTITAETLINTTRDALGEWTSITGNRSAVFCIGDAKKPRRLNNAIHDGYRLGMEV